MILRKAAAALEVPTVDLPWQQFSYATAITHFAQAIGGARSGQTDRARRGREALGTIQRGLVATPVAGPYDWAAQVESMRLGASAWIAHAEGRNDDAVAHARAAADLEHKVGKHPVTPGAVLPVTELLGDLLLDLDRPGEALEAFEASLADSPGRFNALVGAARAAVRAGQRDKARDYYGKLVQQADAVSMREEVREARAFLDKS